jgi:integrase/recombinase XerD
MKPLAARTVKNYSNYVKRWEASGMEPEAWLDTLSEANAANARKALRHHLPELRLRYRHEPEPAPKALTKSEIERCRLACADELVRACFDWLLLTGMRPEEFLRLRPEHVHAGTVYVQATKTGTRERPIPQHPDLDVSILPVEYGLSWLEKWLGRAGARAGTHLYPRLLRSTFATRLLEEGADIVTVQHLMGHKNIETTLRYLAVTDERKRAAINLLGNMRQPLPEANTGAG